MAVWNASTMLRFRAFSSLCRTAVLYQKNEHEMSAVMLKISKPKKPVNGFIRFLGKKRSDLLMQNPGITAIELSKVGSKIWSNMSEREKSVYNVEYSIELQQYKVLMENYLKKVEAFEHKELLSRGNKLNNVEKKLLGKPKRPVTPFFLFRASLKAATPDMPLSVYQVKEKWLACDDKEKKKFSDLYKKQFENYEKELLEWEKLMYKKGYPQVLRTVTMEKLQKSSVDNE